MFTIDNFQEKYVKPVADTNEDFIAMFNVKHDGPGVMHDSDTESDAEDGSNGWSTNTVSPILTGYYFLLEPQQVP